MKYGAVTMEMQVNVFICNFVNVNEESKYVHKTILFMVSLADVHCGTKECIILSNIGLNNTMWQYALY